METKNINILNKIISIFLFVHAVYFLYVVAFSVFLYFSPDDIVRLIIYSLFFLESVLLIASGIGILRKRRWSIIMYWIVIVLPIIFPFAQPFRGYYGYFLITSNAVLATILTLNNWKTWSKP